MRGHVRPRRASDEPANACTVPQRLPPRRVKRKVLVGILAPAVQQRLPAAGVLVEPRRQVVHFPALRAPQLCALRRVRAHVAYRPRRVRRRGGVCAGRRRPRAGVRRRAGGRRRRRRRRRRRARARGRRRRPAGGRRRRLAYKRRRWRAAGRGGGRRQPLGGVAPPPARRALGARLRLRRRARDVTRGDAASVGAGEDANGRRGGGRRRRRRRRRPRRRPEQRRRSRRRSRRRRGDQSRRRRQQRARRRAATQRAWRAAAGRRRAAQGRPRTRCVIAFHDWRRVTRQHKRGAPRLGGAITHNNDIRAGSAPPSEVLLAHRKECVERSVSG
jgi:hypothetical protein